VYVAYQGTRFCLAVQIGRYLKKVYRAQSDGLRLLRVVRITQRSLNNGRAENDANIRERSVERTAVYSDTSIECICSHGQTVDF